MADAPQSSSPDIELRPCPFCGGGAVIEQVGSTRQSTIYACEDCSCRLETGEVFKIGTRWNSRHDGAATPSTLLTRARQFVADSGSDEDDSEVNAARNQLLAEMDAALTGSVAQQPRVFPYQQTFDAIASAVSLYPDKQDPSGISISVRKFQETFNNHHNTKTSAIPSTERK